MLLLPLATLVLAAWSDRSGPSSGGSARERTGYLPPVLGGRDPNGKGLSPAMGTRVPLDSPDIGYGSIASVLGGRGDDRGMSPVLGARVPSQYGILPLLAPAAVEGAVLVGPWAGSAVVAASPVLEAGMLWAGLGAAALVSAAIQAIAGEGHATDWGTDSPAWKSEMASILAAAAAAGHPLNPDCAWLFSGQTRIRRMVQDAFTALRNEKYPGDTAALISRAWARTAKSMKEVAGFAAENAMPNLLGIPAAAGLLTQAMTNVEAIWWARFVAALIAEGVPFSDLDKVEQAVGLSQTLCRNGIANVPKAIRGEFSRYLSATRMLRQAILKQIVSSANPKAIAIALLGTTLGGAVFEVLKNVVRDLASTGGIFKDLHEALDAMAVETSGVLPAGRAMWRAEAMDGVLVDMNGEVFEEGLVVPGRYHIRIRLRPGETPTLLQIKGKPAALEVKAGHAYTLWLDGKKAQIRDDDLSKPRT